MTTWHRTSPGLWDARTLGGDMVAVAYRLEAGMWAMACGFCQTTYRFRTLQQAMDFVQNCADFIETTR